MMKSWMQGLTFPFAACTFLAIVAGTAHAAPSESPVLPVEILDQVFTLEEAARYLRVTPTEVESLAREGTLPGRKLGAGWRFSRISLLQWLNHDRPLRIEAAPRTADAGVSAAKPLERTELAGITGRGIGGTPGESTVAQAAIAPVGEKPTAPTAEEVALRDQRVLLTGGQTTAEFGLNYARAEAQLLGAARVEQNLATTGLTVRYGLRDNLQLSAAMLYSWDRNAVFTATGKNADHDNRFGDLSLALFGVGMRETVGRPSLIWNLQAVAPTGPGDAGLGGGLSVTKSYDPVVLFGSLSYLYGIRTDINEPNRVLARHNLGLSFGYAFSINESIALTGQVTGSYRSYEQTVVGLAPPRERYQLQFGLTYLLTPKLFVEPTVALGLSNSAPDTVFGVRMPYTF